jgi:hypothetical protein
MNDSKAVWTIIFTVILSSLALLVFGHKIVYNFIFGFNDASSLGDFVAGVAGPIIALGGAYMMYITIQAQIEANRIQREALQTESDYRVRRDIFNQIETICNSITKDVQSLSYTSSGINYQGTSALRMIFLDLSHGEVQYAEGVVDVVNHCLFMLTRACSIIEFNIDLLSYTDILTIKSSTASIFNSYLQKFAYGYTTNSRQGELIGSEEMKLNYTDLFERIARIEKWLISKAKSTETNGRP